MASTKAPSLLSRIASASCSTSTPDWWAMSQHSARCTGDGSPFVWNWTRWWRGSGRRPSVLTCFSISEGGWPPPASPRAGGSEGVEWGGGGGGWGVEARPYGRGRGPPHTGGGSGGGGGRLTPSAWSR